MLARFRHLEGRDFARGGVTNTVTQRARAGMRFDLEPVTLNIEIQDVRIWGAEADTLNDFSAEGFDLHQGYLQAQLADGLALRVGRQEIDWLNQRLIGSVGWIEQARSLDAARLVWRGVEDRMVVDAFYARTRHDLDEGELRAEHLFAALWQYAIDDAFVPAVLAIVDLNGPSERTRVTTGAHVTGRFEAGFSYSLEGFWQGGSGADDTRWSAFLTALRLRQTLVDVPTRPWLELRAEIVSGDDDPTEAIRRSFDTLFATNHAFYGEMDFFLNLPTQTGDRGLIDLGGRIGLAPTPSTDVSLAVHHFVAHEARGGAGVFGTEVDLRGEWRISKELRVDLVYAFLVPGSIHAVDGADAWTEHFVYSTFHARF